MQMLLARVRGGLAMAVLAQRHVDRLGQPVGADGQTHEKRRGIVQIASVNGENRQNHKQAEHAQHVDSGERQASATLLGRHRDVDFQWPLQGNHPSISNNLAMVSGSPFMIRQRSPPSLFPFA